MEQNLVEIWLRKDPVRWIAGIMAGLFGGALTLCFAAFLSTLGGLEFWFPIKLLSTIFLGNSATEYGMNLANILPGLILFETLAAFFGLVFAHFTGTNSLRALLPMGVVWGIFSWIFVWNLFLQSFRPIYAARIPAGPLFPICIFFGVSLASVSFFDRMLRHGKPGPGTTRAAAH